MTYKMTSNKPYLLRAIYDWIVDNAFTPYLVVDVKIKGVQVPMDHVDQGRIILDISPQACRGLVIEQNRIVFSTRFSQEIIQIAVPPKAVLAIYAKENGQGMNFPQEDIYLEEPMEMDLKRKSKPKLTIVKKE